jgi:hypothetical protein
MRTPSSVETFRQNVALQRGLGVDVQWLDAREAGALAPGLSTDGVLAATFCQRDGIADPNGVTMGFAKTAQSLGVTVERDVEVTGISAAAEDVEEGVGWLVHVIPLLWVRLFCSYLYDEWRPRPRTENSISLRTPSAWTIPVRINLFVSVPAFCHKRLDLVSLFCHSNHFYEKI